MQLATGMPVVGVAVTGINPSLNPGPSYHAVSPPGPAPSGVAKDPALALEELAAKGYPLGLARELTKACQVFPLRFWVVDNSGSMQTADGSRLVTDSAGNKRMISCTRWQELVDTVALAAELAIVLGARTDFALLNPAAGVPQVLTAGADPHGLPVPPGKAVDLSELKTNLSLVSPAGTTPLTEAVIRVCTLIEPMAGQLRAQGQQCVLTLATDGQPNDPVSFQAALQRLQSLPVWVVVRLCTDEEAIVDYWSELDAKLELPLEVLDDEKGEAKEVSGFNPWLTYGQPLHIARAFGLQNKLFDLLDERSILPTQLKSFCELLLGCPALPEPEIEREAFIAALQEALATAPSVYDPLTLREAPWVKVRHLQPLFGPGQCCVIS